MGSFKISTSSDSASVSLSVYRALFLKDLEGYIAFFGNPWIILSSTKPNIRGGSDFSPKQWVQSNEEKEMEKGFWI